jgi:hypothetical protein
MCTHGVKPGVATMVSSFRCVIAQGLRSSEIQSSVCSKAKVACGCPEPVTEQPAIQAVSTHLPFLSPSFGTTPAGSLSLLGIHSFVS